jgi:hypothetical protein
MTTAEEIMAGVRLKVLGNPHQDEESGRSTFSSVPYPWFVYGSP